MEKYCESLRESDEDLIESAERLTYEALAEVAYRYGSGFEGDMHQPAVQDLAFHNLQHSWRAKDTAGTIARGIGLDEYDTRLAELIASAHDVIHESTDEKLAEELSADWLVAKMQADGFPEEDQEIARLGTLSTIARLDHENGRIIQQFNSMTFPSERAYQIALCVTGSDMETMISPYGPYNAHNVFKEEYAGVGWGKAPLSLDGFVGFQQFQLGLIENFEPLHPVIGALSEPLRQPAIAHHQAILNDVLTGAITTWNEIEERDIAFSEQWSLAGSAE